MNYLEGILMSNQKKGWKALNIKLDENIYKQLEEYCEESRKTKTAVVELALEEYFKNKRRICNG